MVSHSPVCARYRVSDPKPPTPQFSGSSTPWARAVVTAASIALPPCSRTAAPISTALDCGATIIPGIDSFLPYRLASQGPHVCGPWASHDFSPPFLLRGRGQRALRGKILEGIAHGDENP